MGRDLLRCQPYDGRNWHNFLEKDSGLPGNFIDQVKTIDGEREQLSTDKGLAYFDGRVLIECAEF